MIKPNYCSEISEEGQVRDDYAPPKGGKMGMGAAGAGGVEWPQRLPHAKGALNAQWCAPCRLPLVPLSVNSTTVAISLV